MDEKNIKKLWRCARCKKRLPRKARIWRLRFKLWLEQYPFIKDDPLYTYPYYCDDCKKGG